MILWARDNGVCLIFREGFEEGGVPKSKNYVVSCIDFVSQALFLLLVPYRRRHVFRLHAILVALLLIGYVLFIRGIAYSFL